MFPKSFLRFLSFKRQAKLCTLERRNGTGPDDAGYQTVGLPSRSKTPYGPNCWKAGQASQDRFQYKNCKYYSLAYFQNWSVRIAAV